MYGGGIGFILNGATWINDGSQFLAWGMSASYKVTVGPSDLTLESLPWDSSNRLILGVAGSSSRPPYLVYHSNYGMKDRKVQYVGDNGVPFGFIAEIGDNDIATDFVHNRGSAAFLVSTVVNGVLTQSKITFVDLLNLAHVQLSIPLTSINDVALNTVEIGKTSRIFLSGNENSQSSTSVYSVDVKSDYSYTAPKIVRYAAHLPTPGPNAEQVTFVNLLDGCVYVIDLRKT